MFATPLPLWFGHGEQERLFFPFGIKRKGYRVFDGDIERLERWTELRAHLPLTLATLYFLPVVAFWGPSWSASGRLTAGALAFALAVLVVLVLASGWLIDRAVYSLLLRRCEALNRLPTRSEQQVSSGRVGPSFANRNSSPLAVRWSCLLVGFAAVLYGLHGGDVWLSLSGLLLGAFFALDAIRDSCHRIHLWLLSDTAS